MIASFIKYRKFYFLIFLTLLLFLFLPSSSCTKEKIPTGKEEDLTSVFSKPADTTKIIIVTTESGGRMKVAGNQLLISVNADDIDAQDVKTIIEDTGGEIVGQIPNLGIYQAEYSFSSEAELKDMKTTLESKQEIELTAYNGFPRPRTKTNTKDYCEKNYDNHTTHPVAQVFYFDIGYYLAVPIMGFVREHMTLSKVNVAVADSEINNTITKEFDDVPKYFPQVLEPTVSDSHGTQVAGMIAADNFDRGINGIATSLTDNNLELISVYHDSNKTQMEEIEDMYVSITSYGINIYNMSYGYEGLDKNGKPIRVSNERYMHKKTFEYFSDVLFIAAADNQYYELTINNGSPAGIPLDNVITVSGLQYANPEKACTWTQYGPLIDISAQAEHVPTVDPSRTNSVLLASGTSFATPAVSALAVVLKSIHPSLTPGDIKKYILDYSYPTDPSVGGRRLYLPLPIMQLLIDINAPEEIINKIDITDPIGIYDNPGAVAGRICGISKIKIDAVGEFTFPTSDTTGIGALSESTATLSFSDDNNTIAIGFWNMYEILDKEVNFVEFTDPFTNTGTVSMQWQKDVQNFGNSITGGQFKVIKCRILERDPIFDRPLVLSIEAEMNGTMELILNNDILNPVESSFSGQINTNMIVFGQSDEFYQYIEDNAEPI